MRFERVPRHKAPQATQIDCSHVVLSPIARQIYQQTPMCALPGLLVHRHLRHPRWSGATTPGGRECTRTLRAAAVLSGLVAIVRV